MYEDCLQTIRAWKYGSLRKIDIELIILYVIPHLHPLVSKYNASKNIEIFKKIFGTESYRFPLLSCIGPSKILWLEIEGLCKFLNKIFYGKPFEIRSGLFLKGGKKNIFMDFDTVIPFLNFLQKTTPYHWVCYPHGIGIICCQSWSKILELVDYHIDGSNDRYNAFADSGIQEFIFSDETWERLQDERPDYTCTKRASVYDEIMY